MNTTTGRIVIAGGSGFLGRGLTKRLLARGDEVTVLGRSATAPAQVPAGVRWVQWDARMVGEWAACLDGARAVVNLVGRSVDCRKTAVNKRAILESRIDSCRALGAAMRTVARPPAVWVQSGTAHIVGDPEPRDTVCDDATPAGPMHEMAPSVGVAWEKAFAEATLPDGVQRGVFMRISFVLGAGGGALPMLRRITRLGLGGTAGRGDQWISWIHEDDLHRLFLAAIDDAAYHGTYMVTAPGPVTNRDFMRAMRRACGRPWSPPAPAVAIRLACRLVLNTDPELVLLGRRCVPRRLLDEHHFAFGNPTLDAALQTLCGAS